MVNLPAQPRNLRGKKKSDTERVDTGTADPAAAEAQIAQFADEVRAMGETLQQAAPEASGEPEPDREESIYEVMKETMRRQKEELEAKNAQLKKQGYGRPAAQPPPPPAPPKIDKVGDLTDLAAVWTAARDYLAANARILESVLGACSRVEALDNQANQVTLAIPAAHQRFTNERAQAKLEEALRTVTDLPLRLQVNFVDQPLPAPGPGIGVTPAGQSMAAQRIPPELMDAVKSQPIVRELMKRLDATITQVEIIAAPGATDENG